MASQNKSLGRFKLDGIPPMMAGMPQVEITYDIDANGVLHVTAKEKSTGKEANITIQNTTTLSEEEVKRMVKDAQDNAEADRQVKELAEAKNQLDSLRIQARRVVDEATAATDDQKQPVLKAIDEAQAAIDSNASKERLEELGKTLAEKLTAFQQATASQAQANPTQEPGSAAKSDQDDDVIDADFKPAS